MTTIGHRLATSAGTLCPDRRPTVGLTLHDLDQYGEAYRAEAAGLFTRPGLPSVLAVARGGAAERAGVLPDDALVRIDGEAVAPARPGGGLERVEAIMARVDRSALDGSVELELARGATMQVRRVPAVPGCVTRFQVRVAAVPEAKADGWLVEVTTGMLDFLRSTDELAAVLAHELAHNILRHRERLDAAGISRGFLQHFGRSARLTRETEAEADRLAVHLVDRAGFSTTAMAPLWSRMNRELNGGSETHPSDARRVALIEAERTHVADAKARGIQTAPTFPSDAGERRP